MATRSRLDELQRRIADLTAENERLRKAPPADGAPALPVSPGLAIALDPQQRGALQDSFLEWTLSAQDEERRRIARELHDDLGAWLTSLGIGLRELGRAEDLNKVREHATRLQGVAEITLDNLRRIARGLHPSLLDDLGFATALEHYAAGIAEAHHMRVDVHVAGLQPPNDPSRLLALALYRIVQESLTNAIRHGRANHVSVIVTREGNEVRLVVEDDGCGLEPGGAGDSQGMGLRFIRERVGLLRGDLAIESSPGGGCVVAVRLPLIVAG